MKEIAKTIGALVFTAVALGFAVVVFWIGGQIDEATGNSASNCSNKQIEAYVMAQSRIESMLRDPKSAEFPNTSNSQVLISMPSDCQFVISSFVRARNGFGGMTLERWSAEARYSKDTDGWIVRARFEE